jgi:hypothetical protein
MVYSGMPESRISSSTSHHPPASYPRCTLIRVVYTFGQDHGLNPCSGNFLSGRKQPRKITVRGVRPSQTPARTKRRALSLRIIGTSNRCPSRTGQFLDHRRSHTRVERCQYKLLEHLTAVHLERRDSFITDAQHKS